MVLAGGSQIRAVLVLGAGTHLPTPCGGCRQVMAELAPHAVVFLTNMQGNWVETSVAALLPGAFAPNDLPKK